jgi:hypothetical protein
MTEPAGVGISALIGKLDHFATHAGCSRALNEVCREAAEALRGFAPILAEKAERDAHEAKLVETGKWLQELAENPPEPNEALKKLFADYKAASIRSVGLDDDWKARALAAEAALAGERERCLAIVEAQVPEWVKERSGPYWDGYRKAMEDAAEDMPKGTPDSTTPHRS